MGFVINTIVSLNCALHCIKYKHTKIVSLLYRVFEITNDVFSILVVEYIRGVKKKKKKNIPEYFLPSVYIKCLIYISLINN